MTCGKKVAPTWVAGAGRSGEDGEHDVKDPEHIAGCRSCQAGLEEEAAEYDQLVRDLSSGPYP